MLAGGFLILIIMKIGKNTLASLYYTLQDATTGQVIEQVHEDAPHEFLFGHELMLPGFEEGLKGCLDGDHFEFIIPCAEAYGPVDPYAIFDLPIDTFEEEGKVDSSVVMVGNSFPMQDEMGNRHIGRIIKVMKESVTMDFNHPLAGKDLKFSGKVIKVREASIEDIRKAES